jgi:hypothetical protein
VKKAAHKIKRKEIKREGFFQSPFFIGFMNLLPMMMLFLGLWYLGMGLVSKIENGNKVLGAKSDQNMEVKIGVSQRIDELKKILSEVESEKIRDEIIRLESL